MSIVDEVFRVSADEETFDFTYVLGQGAWRELIQRQIDECVRGLNQNSAMTAVFAQAGHLGAFSETHRYWQDMLAMWQKALTELPPEGTKLYGQPVTVDLDKPDDYVGIKR